MAKLGFTFYPKDWWTSDTFFELNEQERYIYLECMFLMYQNNGYLKTQKTQFETRMRMKISDDLWNKITGLFIKDKNDYTLLSVNDRLKKAVVSRQNGRLGGRPPKNPENPEINPPYKEKEKLIEIKTIENYIKEISNSEIYLEGFYMKYRLEKGSASKLLNTFKQHLKMNPKVYGSFTEFRNHFSNWIQTQENNKQLEKYKTEKSGAL